MQKILVASIIAAGLVAMAGIVLGYSLSGQLDAGAGIDNDSNVTATVENKTKFLQEVEFPSDRYLKAGVVINDTEISVDVAGTTEQKRKGLSVRDSMPENEGMLFVFDDERRHSFWMKGMKFPIDIMWIDGNYTVVHIEHSLPACDSILGNCKSYDPSEKSLYVLETVAGYAKKYGIDEGTKVEFVLYD